MKYRIQLNAVFNNTNANAILNRVETDKTKVYKAVEYTQVEIMRVAKKYDYDSVENNKGTERESVDFDASQDTHSGEPTGVSEFYVELDISFSVQSDFDSFMNYLEGIKDNYINPSGEDYIRIGRNFDCKHEESPLTKDGAYTYMDFDGVQLTYPL